MDSAEQIAEFETQMRAVHGHCRFFDTALFPWLAGLQAQWPQMRAELDAVLAATACLPGFEDIQTEQAVITDDGRWKILPFVAYGHRVEQNLRRCPGTARALAAIPGLRAAMLSILEGGKTLPAHRGPYAGVLRLHLGLKVPEPADRCGISVGGETRHWAEGRCLVFDDAHLHHAWNHAADSRVVLFVDFDRPLPAGLRERNETIIEQIGAEPFITAAAARWQQWETVHGARLDAACLAAGTRKP